MTIIEIALFFLLTPTKSCEDRAIDCSSMYGWIGSLSLSQWVISRAIVNYSYDAICAYSLSSSYFLFLLGTGIKRRIRNMLLLTSSFLLLTSVSLIPPYIYILLLSSSFSTISLIPSFSSHTSRFLITLSSLNHTPSFIFTSLPLSSSSIFLLLHRQIQT